MNKKSTQKMRSLIQLFFFLIIATIAINHTLAESGKGIEILSSASLHALCPFGGVVTLYNLLTLGTFIQKIHMSSLILMVIVLLLAILFGPVFCSYICPMGTVQEWISKVGKKIFKNRFNHFVPMKLHIILINFRYVVLLMVIFITAKSGYLMFAEVDPYNALFSFWSDEVSLVALTVLGIVLVASLFVERPWCKYACPYGALLGLSNKIRIFKIKRNGQTCISCNKCTNSCPMNIDVAKSDYVKSAQCISCLKCTSEFNCPVPNTVNLQLSLSKDKEERV